MPLVVAANISDGLLSVNQPDELHSYDFRLTFQRCLQIAPINTYINCCDNVLAIGTNWLEIANVALSIVVSIVSIVNRHHEQM